MSVTPPAQQSQKLQTEEIVGALLQRCARPAPPPKGTIRPLKSDDVIEIVVTGA